jgi:ParD-like antitoxin of type II bacterial toxin-antitoxin system
MGQPVKLSDELMMRARVAASSMDRSIAGQVEFWANVGEAVEKVANRRQIEHLQSSAAMPLSEIVDSINKPAGRARLKAYLDSRPFPRFAAHPDLARTFIREDADGSKVVGRFKSGRFEPLEAEQRA